MSSGAGASRQASRWTSRCPSAVHAASTRSVSLDMPLAEVPSTATISGAASPGSRPANQAASRAPSSAWSRLERRSSVTSGAVPRASSAIVFPLAHRHPAPGHATVLGPAAAVKQVDTSSARRGTVTTDTRDVFVSEGGTMDRDDGTIDWDAAFEAIVAPLRPARHVRIAGLVWRSLLAVALAVLTCWSVMHTIVAPLGQ